MRPKDQNMLQVLNLLVLLYKTKKQMNPKAPEDELDMLLITKENLEMTGLTLPVFLNTLDMLGNKGYALYMAPLSKEAHDEIQRFQKSEDFSKGMAELAKRDTSEINLEIRKSIARDIPKLAPKDMVLDEKALLNDTSISIENMLKAANDHVMQYRKDTVGSVMMLPFRSIERLLEKMNAGMKYDDVQDAGIWYDSRSFQFHFGDRQISTAYNGTPMLVHFILDTMFNKLRELRVDYSECSEFSSRNDLAKEKKKFSDAMRGFMSKDPELSKIFKVHATGLEIQKEFWDSAH